ncbi:MAG: DUF975 family protein [Lachnospiraceae bacterium]|nr:DUF975 family protein [Lachnospiraceae bacterium]
MWTRKELKERGKAAFKANYWRAVLVGLIMTVLFGGGYSAVGRMAGNSFDDSADITSTADITETPDVTINGKDMTPEDIENILTEAGVTPQDLISIALGIFAVASVLLLFIKVIDILLLNPLEVGCENFFLRNAEEPADLGTIGRAFSPRWANNVITLLLRDIFLYLWFCLFLIPGFVKMYSYRMVPFILADNPDMGGTEAITLSRRMMDGQKWNAFVLDLSFIGWYFLAALTFGLVGIFWTQPYRQATDAELYRVLKQNV